MRVVNISQGSQEWLEWRRKGITATDAVVIAGRSPYKSKWRLWAEKTGFCREVDLSMNPMVRRGRELEDAARAAYEALFCDLLLPVCIESDVDPILRASLDGLTTQSGEPVEIKCPTEKVWHSVCADQEHSDTYKLYWPQVQFQLLCSGSKTGRLVFYFEGQLQIFNITADLQFLRDLYRECKLFWESVKNKDEPERDPIQDLYIPMGAEASRWLNASENYRILDLQLKELKNKVKDLEAKQREHLEEMKSLMGVYTHADYGGVMVTKYLSKGKVDLNAMVHDGKITQEQCEAYRLEPTERCRVTVNHNDAMPRHVVDSTVTAPLRDIGETVIRYF